MSETYPGQMLPELQEKTTVDSNDLFYMVSSNASKKIKGSNLKDQMKPSDYTGATSSTNGANGLVPQPTTSDVDRFLKGDGTWGDISYAVGEASGSIATFSDGSPLPMRSLKAYIEPVQSGSGEPSPSNIRPISGWIACNLCDDGINLAYINYGSYNKSAWDEESETLYGQTVYSKLSAWNGIAPYIWVKKGKYAVSLYAKSGKSGGESVAFYVASNKSDYPTTDVTVISTTGLSISSSWSRITAIINVIEDGYIAPRIERTSSDSSKLYVSCHQIEVGETVNDFTPYNGSIYTIQFTDGSNPLTVYGGYVDIVSGLLVVDRAITSYTDSDVSLHTGSISGVTYAKVPKQVNSKTYNNYSSEALTCNKFKNGNGTAIQGGVGLIRSDADTKHYFIGLEPGITLEEAKEIINGTQLVYERATPQTYQLTAQQVKSLLGENNVWADTGDVDVHYVRDLTITIDDILSRLEALEG